MPKEPQPATTTEIHGAYQVDFAAQPATGNDVGGDVLFLESDGTGDLRFFIADMAGSGLFGDQNWQLVAPAVRRSWRRLCESSCSPRDLQQFGEAVNEAAFVAGTSLCAAAGRINPQRLAWAGWGWGVHVLASSTGESSPLPPAEQAYGLKLGWLPAAEFNAMRGAFIPRAVSSPTQVVLFTDGLLGDDHADPAGTWTWIEGINQDIAGIEANAALAWLLGRSQLGGDDITAALVAPLVV